MVNSDQMCYNYIKTPILQAAQSCLSNRKKLSLKKPSFDRLALGLASLATDQRGLFIYPVKERRQKMTSGIYYIVNTVNNKRYIGSSTNIKQRWSMHKSTLNRGIHRNVFLQRSWYKYGPDAFEFRLVEVVINPADLIGREQEHIDLCPWEESYNIRTIADSNRGIKFTDEHRANIAAAARGRKHSDETKVKMSVSRMGRRQSPEASARKSASTKGRRLGPEWRAKISATMSRPVEQLDPITGEVLNVWPSGKRAAMELGIAYSFLCACAAGHYKTAHGYGWRYI